MEKALIEFLLENFEYNGESPMILDELKFESLSKDEKYQLMTIISHLLNHPDIEWISAPKFMLNDVKYVSKQHNYNSISHLNISNNDIIYLYNISLVPILNTKCTNLVYDLILQFTKMAKIKR